MKKIIIVLVLINCPVHAGVSGLITALKGECNPPDKNGVQLCSDKTTGQIYYIKDDVKYEVYPVAPQK